MADGEGKEVRARSAERESLAAAVSSGGERKEGKREMRD